MNGQYEWLTVISVLAAALTMAAGAIGATHAIARAVVADVAIGVDRAGGVHTVAAADGWAGISGLALGRRQADFGGVAALAGRALRLGEAAGPGGLGQPELGRDQREALARRTRIRGGRPGDQQIASLRGRLCGRKLLGCGTDRTQVESREHEDRRLVQDPCLGREAGRGHADDAEIADPVEAPGCDLIRRPRPGRLGDEPPQVSKARVLVGFDLAANNDRPRSEARWRLESPEVGARHVAGRLLRAVGTGRRRLVERLKMEAAADRRGTQA